MAVSSGQNASTRGKVGQTDNQVDGFGDGAGTWKARGGVKKNGPNGEGAGQDNDLAAIQAIFQGMQQNMPTPEGVRRPMIRRGMSGAILDENGQDPGSGFNVFQRNNPHLATQEQRQAQFEREQNTLAQQRQAAGANAVDFAKQTRGFTDANGNFVKPTLPSDSLFKPIGGGASSVTGSDGYKSVFDQNGRAVGTNRPIGGPQDKGMWDITSTNPRNPNLGQQIQDNAFGPTSRKGGVPAMPPASSSSSNNDPMLNSVFGGNGAKPATAQPQTYSDGKTLGQREAERRQKNIVGLGAPGPAPAKTSYVPMGSDIPNTTETPYGINQGLLSYGVPAVKGLFPNIAQGLNGLYHGAQGVWDMLAGNPNTAYQQWKNEEQQRAMDQYKRGVAPAEQGVDQTPVGALPKPLLPYLPSGLNDIIYMPAPTAPSQFKYSYPELTSAANIFQPQPKAAPPYSGQPAYKAPTLYPRPSGLGEREAEKRKSRKAEMDRAINNVSKTITSLK